MVAGQRPNEAELVLLEKSLRAIVHSLDGPLLPEALTTNRDVNELLSFLAGRLDPLMQLGVFLLQTRDDGLLVLIGEDGTRQDDIRRQHGWLLKAEKRRRNNHAMALRPIHNEGHSGHLRQGSEEGNDSLHSKRANAQTAAPRGCAHVLNISTFGMHA